MIVPTKAGVAQLVELQPSKLEVASSSLVSRSILFRAPSDRDVLTKATDIAHVAQSVERFLGKEEVHRFDSDRGLHSNVV
jgi:hypothetical protein